MHIHDYRQAIRFSEKRIVVNQQREQELVEQLALQQECTRLLVRDLQEFRVNARPEGE